MLAHSHDLCQKLLNIDILSFFLCNTMPKLKLIGEFIFRQVLTVQTLSKNLYCLENLPLGGASIHCKHLQY